MAAIDLHVHSTASDGDERPADVVARARVAGVATMALTDHDTVAGVPEAEAAGERHDVRVIRGCEFSVRAPWGELHLLGYFLPLAHAELEEFLATQRQARLERMNEIVRRLAASGVTIAREDVEQVASGATMGRPHAARALVARGAVPTVNAAFDRYLANGRPAFVPKRLPPLEQVTALVRRVAGVTSAAHLGDRAAPAALATLQQLGVDAVEVRHPAHDERKAARIARAARTLGLALTGGSDWHGERLEGDPRRARLGSLSIPAEWLAGLEQLHHHRLHAEVIS